MFGRISRAFCLIRSCFWRILGRLSYSKGVCRIPRVFLRFVVSVGCSVFCCSLGAVRRIASVFAFFRMPREFCLSPRGFAICRNPRLFCRIPKLFVFFCRNRRVFVFLS